jgi:Holliday junction resolvasome RuvABC endonuclease subunit
MIILGLDIATTTGFSVLENDRIIEYGTIKLKSKLEHRFRFKDFREALLSILTTYKPDIVIIEATYSGRNRKTTAYLNMLRGIALECIPESSELITIAVSSARMDILGEGKKHDKLEVFHWIVNKFNLKNFVFKKHNDITDSILISFWAFLQKS